MNEIQKLTTTELKAELRRRRDEHRAAEGERRRQANQLVFQNIDILLQLVPEHSRTTCSDENLHLQSNIYRCKRCFLLQAKECGFIDEDYEVEIDIGLQLRPLVESLEI